MDMDQAVAIVVNREMERRGITQRDLARRLGVGTGTVNRWVLGKRVIGINWLHRISKEIGLRTATLIARAEKDLENSEPTLS